MNDQTDYVSSQSQCSDSNHELEDKKFDNPDVDIPNVDNPNVDNPDVDNPEVENHVVDNSEGDKPKVDNPEVDNPFVSPYQCNMTGMCKVSHKHRVQNHNIGKYSNILISLCLKAFP